MSFGLAPALRLPVTNFLTVVALAGELRRGRLLLGLHPALAISFALLLLVLLLTSFTFACGLASFAVAALA